MPSKADFEERHFLKHHLSLSYFSYRWLVIPQNNQHFFLFSVFLLSPFVFGKRVGEGKRKQSGFLFPFSNSLSASVLSMKESWKA